MSRLNVKLILPKRSSAGRRLTGAFSSASRGGLAIGMILAVAVLYSTGALVLKKDAHGNPVGDRFDLFRDGYFKDYTLAVLQLYTGEGFTFEEPKAALEQKGFEVKLWRQLPDLNEFRSVLSTASQLWIISHEKPLLNGDYLSEIERFFEQGGGLYIAGDNEPYYVDANAVLERFFNARLEGNNPGRNVVRVQVREDETGFRRHPVMTGLVAMYVGTTISTLQPQGKLDPLLYDSNGKAVLYVYEENGRRLIVDGGFTRLYPHWWNEAGTARFVKNAAGWLAARP